MEKFTITKSNNKERLEKILLHYFRFYQQKKQKQQQTQRKKKRKNILTKSKIIQLLRNQEIYLIPYKKKEGNENKNENENEKEMMMICSPKYKVKENDIVYMTKKVIEMREGRKEEEKEEEEEIKGENIKINVIYEDEKEFIIVNKQRGISVHISNNEKSNTLVNGLIYHYGKEQLSNFEGNNNNNNEYRPGIVHRIDKNTTGLLVIAKNNKTHEILKKQFINHETIHRIYYCLVVNHFQNDKGLIDSEIGRHPTNFVKRITKVQLGKGGKCKKNTFRNAVTMYEVLKRFVYQGKKYSLVKCELKTGRTHQIRVHLSSLGRSIVGDTLYGPKKKLQPFLDILGKDEGKCCCHLLHAKKLGFLHPVTNEYIEFECDLPDYFQEVLKLLGCKYIKNRLNI